MPSPGLLRWICAVSIATGACMHAAGLALAARVSFVPPWWMTLIYWTAIVGYSASAAGVVLRRRAAVFFAVLGPAVGGTMIFLGLMVPGLGFQVLIPGTFGHEIRPIGFLTLVVEPMAVLSGVLLLLEPRGA